MAGKPRRFERTDQGNARRFAADHSATLRFVPELDCWLAWDGTRWARDAGGVEAMRKAKRTTDVELARARKISGDEQRKNAVKWALGLQSRTSLTAMLQLARSEHDITVPVRDLDQHPGLLNVANGTIDLNTGLRSPARPMDLLTMKADVVYDEQATCPRWLEFLDQIFQGDQDLIAFMQRAAGYTLSGEVKEHILLFLHGDGANGKSVFVNTLSHVFGEYATDLYPTVLVASSLEQHPTGLMSLRGARFAAASETEQGRQLSEVTAKQLTGGDAITARGMRQDFVTFGPSHTLWMTGNYRLHVRGTDNGIWRRVKVVPFTRIFTADEQDKHLESALRDEASGILNWLIEGYAAWHEGGLNIAKSVTNATNDYRREEDQVGRFLEDCCEVDVGHRATARELRTAYEVWCDTNGEKPRTAKALGADLKRRGFESERAGRGKVHTWIGFRVAVTFDHFQTTQGSAN